MRIDVTARGTSFSFDTAPDEKILLAGLRAGFDLPYECGTGTCGTCRARLTAGEVGDLWPQAPGRDLIHPERGDILMCQSVARSDCAVQIRGRAGPMAEAAIRPAHRGATLRALQPLNHNIRRLEVALDEPASFEAGQFMLVQADGVRGARGLSMATFERPAEALVFTAKLMPGGAFSAWLDAEDRTGAPLRLFGPMGKAFFRPGEQAHVLGIAGGSGLAPILSILDRGVASGHFATHRADIFVGARTMQDLYMMDALQAAHAAHPETVSVTVALSHEAPPDDVAARFPGIGFATGLVPEVAGHAMAGRYADVTAYLAGPPPMVEAAMRVLVVDAKLPPSRIRYDKFS